MTAIILAGGIGTRLKSIVNDVPKPMALINEIPFLTYLLKYLKTQKVTDIIISVGYKGFVIQDYYSTEYSGIPIRYSVEDKPLGTGGAIKCALDYCNDSSILVLNGDSLFGIDVNKLMEFHIEQKATITLSLKKMYNVNRYGTINLDNNSITEMKEKAYVEQGYINGGVYSINKNIFDMFSLPERFSFEEFISDNIRDLNIFGFPTDGNFIDIGIPEDYLLAQKLLPDWIEL